MTEPKRILLVEDLPTDAELAEREIRKALPDCRCLRVETRDEYLEKLAEFKPDLIVSDYKLPSFDGLSALRIALENAPETPFIILTGSMNEETAVECMKAGAWDYVIKEHIRRLGQAVLAAMDKRRAHEEKTEALESLRESEELFRKLFQEHAAVKLIMDPQTGAIVDANQAAETFYGWTLEKLRSMNIQEINTLTPEEVREEMAKVGGRKRVHFEFQHRKADGAVRDVEVFSSNVRFKNRDLLHSIIHDITDRKQAERDLRESEERFSQAFRNNPSWLTIVHMETQKILEVNDAWTRLIGYTRDEAIGRTAVELGIFDEAAYRAIINEMRSKGSIRNVEVTAKDRAGESRVLLVSREVIEIGGDKYLLAMGIDITDRKRADEALKKSEEEYRLLAENILDVIWKMDLDLRYTYVNPAITKITGYTVDEWIGTRLSHHCDEENLERIAQVVREGIAKGPAGRGAVFEAVMLKKNGEPIPVEIHGKVLSGVSGAPIGLQGVTRDISERKRAEEALRASEERFRILAGGAFEGVVISRDGVILDCNDVFCRMSGYSLGEVVGINVLEMVAPEFKEIARRHILSGSEEAYESAFLTKNGDVVPVQVKGKPLPYGGATARIASVRDMSAIKKAEETRRLLAKAIEEAAEGVLITDQAGFIQYANPAVEGMTGFPVEELVGNTPRVFKSGEHDPAFYKELWETISSGHTWSGRLINRRKDGVLFYVEASISPVRDSTGRISNFVAVKRDISEHLEMSKQLLQAQKMEAIGTLAGGIAHDFNNILQVALGYTDLMLGDEEFPRQFRSDLMKINESARRGADLVRRLLTFSRKSEINLQPLNLNRRINELRKMLERVLPKVIKIEIILAEALHTIHADATQIDQVLMNLAVNARDAMPNGGKLLVETSNVVLDDDYVRTHVEAKIGAHVMLTVSDTGVGMEREALGHIFEPFYTTKEEGEGTGLGLAMVHGIVKHHGGHIRCYSEPGQGTTFRVYLPAETAVEEAEDRKFTSLPKGGSETILLVDDEELIRDLGSRILKKGGYEVMTAANGREALEIYKKSGNSIDLVVLDVIMPEMGGKECLEGLIEIDPSVKVVIASGFSANGQTKNTLAAGAKGFVDKPYNIRQVLGVVREILEGR